MSRSAARSARRRPPTSRTARARRQPSVEAERLRTWLPPSIGATLFVGLYVLGNLDVIRTLPALASSAFLLAIIVLFFPMRYVYRLTPLGRAGAAMFCLLWLTTVYGPMYLRMYPPNRIAVIDVTSKSLPLTLPSAGQGTSLDLVIQGHLDPGVQGSTRAARYELKIEDSRGQIQTFQGKFLESFDRRAQGRRESRDVMLSRTTARVTLNNPTNQTLVVSDMTIRGRAEPRLTVSLLPHTQPSNLTFLAAALTLLLGAIIFDRTTGAGQTAASLTIASAAALTATFAFQSVASPEPTFRELFGAAIVGALLGGPIGGLTAWIFQGRRPLAR